jgi:CHAT domain-containing protein
MHTFQQGDLVRAEEEAERGYRDHRSNGSDWAWNFRLLEANVLLWEGRSDRALEILISEPDPPHSGELAVQRLRLEALAYNSVNKFQEGDRSLREAERLCGASIFPACALVTSARGGQEMERGRFKEAQQLFGQVLISARTRGDRFLEASALMNLCWSANEQTHFDQVLDLCGSSLQISSARGFRLIAETVSGNLGWAYFRLGDPERAREVFIEAEKQAEVLGGRTDQARWLTDTGYIDMEARDFEVAEKFFTDSLRLAKALKIKEATMNSLISLAFVSERTNKLDDAQRYADEALAKATEDGNGRDMVYPWLVQGQVAELEHDPDTAESKFEKVATSGDVPVFLKWEAERSLAHLYADENKADRAEHKYHTALTTFENARCDLHERVDSRLPFLSNAQRIYEDYVTFLLAHNRTNEALRVADYDRAKTLTEGLGRPCKPSFAPDPLDAQEIARRAGGTILFFWLGEKQSYLWAITPRATRLFPLDPAATIDAAVRSYRAKLEGPPEILEASNDGSVLYEMLIEPARDFLTKEALAKNDRVFIIPDGSLNSLNFETLTPAPKHYWIEDVTLASAGSLRLLSAWRPTPKQLTGKLLLIGDPVPPTQDDNEYARLPFAAQEVKAIARHFEGKQGRDLTADQATPEAYLNGHPEQFSYIHFVAHGTASRTSPLDSAIILSRDPASKAAAGEDDSFKLYARDIIQHPLHAELVTISACYGAGKRSYSGEGLVGLSWAFLRAGAHNVVGALWDVSSVSSAQLMDKFYAELQKGASPSAALRAAKLSLLHSDNPDFRRPFYWAPFQLYMGSQTESRSEGTNR